MTPHQKIMRAAARGTGTRLNYDEVFDLSMDAAIMTRAGVDDENDQKQRAQQQNSSQDR